MKEIILKPGESVIVRCEESPEPPTPPTFEGIKVVFKNNTGEDIRFSGKFHMYADEEKDAIPLFLCPPNSEEGGYPHWAENPFTLRNGESMEFVFKKCHDYIGDGTKVTETTFDISKYYGMHFKKADSGVWPAGIAAIKFGVCAFDRSKGSTSTGPAMIHAKPIPESNSLIKEGGVYEVVLDKIKDNATLNKELVKVPYKEGDKYKYVVM